MSNSIVTGGILYDLNDIDTLDIEMPWWDQNANFEYEIGDKLYTTTGDLCLYNTAAIGCLYFNRPMIEQFSLDNPYKLVYDGKWTLENFEKLCKAVSADLNGNGEVDVEDRFGLSGSKTVIKMLQEASGIRDATKNADGISEISLDHPNMQTLLETAVRILRDKATTLYVGDFPEDVTYTVFLPAFVDNRLLFHFNWVFMSFERRDMEADFGMRPFPKFDEAQENHYSYDATGYQTFLIVPITNTVPEMTGHVLNAMGYYSKELMTPAFIETSVTDKIMRDNDSAKMLEILNNNRVFEMYDMFKWGGIGTLTGNLLDSKSTDFASAYAAAIEKANTELAKTYETFENK